MSGGGFWAMGGYAGPVWSSMAFACFILVWNVWSARRYHAAARTRALRALAINEGGEK